MTMPDPYDSIRQADARQLDPVAALSQLGAVWSPDFDAYASGQLDISQVRCLLCGQAPCQCRQCEAPYRRYGATEPEPCGMTLRGGECPRGHRDA
jgi:hypothetical protein